MGIRGRLTWLVLSVLAVGMGAAEYMFLESARVDELNDFRYRTEKVLAAVSVTVAVQVAQNDMAALDTLVAELTDGLKERDLRELAVVDDDGRVLAHSDPAQFNSVRADAFTRSAIDSDGPVWEFDGPLFRIAVPAKSGLRWATVSAAYSLDRIQANYERTRRRGLFGMLGLFASIGLALFIGIDRLVVSPLRTLQHAMRRMGEGQLTARVPPLGGREMRELAEYTNRTSQALQTERDNLERAVAERTKELQEANTRLERLAVTDGLTGVFNHRRFQEALQNEFVRAGRHKRPLSVLMVDVDFFKRVNDTLGHPAGDELLRRLADVLGADLRQTDLIARYGGEEFAVLLPETTKGEAVQVGERMRAAVEARL
ncbi:MAG: diguanylate cyclase, partial [Archangium sp.]|nr:diguanylate cyclase [Archangium sp.]